MDSFGHHTKIHIYPSSKYQLDRSCTFNWAGQTYPRAFEACEMKKVFVDFKSKSNYSSLASVTFFHKFVLKANWAHVSMVWSADGMKMILYLVFFTFHDICSIENDFMLKLFNFNENCVIIFHLKLKSLNFIDFLWYNHFVWSENFLFINRFVLVLE